MRRLIDEHYLVGSKRSGVFAVPAVFIVDGHPLPSLRGTIIALQDAGFTDDEVVDWLLSDDETLGRSPIAALLAGHKSEVRRLARTLA
ncbi:DNA-binding protein [compost metagenome]